MNALQLLAAHYPFVQDPDYGILWYAIRHRDQTVTYRFEFRPPRLANITIEARLTQLAHHLNTVARANHINRYGLTFGPSDDFPANAFQGAPNMQRLNLSVALPHVATLLNSWQQLLHSFATLRLEHVYIDLDPFFITDLHRAGGARSNNSISAARQHCIPARLKDWGIENHAGLIYPERRARLPPDLCGPLALCLGRYTFKTAATFNAWLDAAHLLAQHLQLIRPPPATPQWLALHHLYPLVELDDWRAWRIAVFRRIQQGIHPEIIVQGVDWGWTPDQDPQDPDPHTVHLVLTQDAEPHYYLIGRPRTFFAKLKYSPDDRICYRCFTAYRPVDFDLHDCQGASTFQCDKCKRCFPTEAVYREHRADTFHATCEHCQQTGFHGRACWDYHQRDDVCIYTHQGRTLPRSTCADCGSSYRAGATHLCADRGGCRLCNVSYQDDPNHYCPIDSKVTFWNPVVWAARNNEQNYTWNAHWFYDFETEKGEPLPGFDPPRYHPSVMAWCLRLCIPDTVTDRFLNEYQIIPLLCRLIDPETPHLYSDQLHHQVLPRQPGQEPTLRIWGTSLESFIWVCENVCAYDDALGAARPTFWAHNGSKFDVKFVLDYFTAPRPYGRNMPLSGETYQRVPATDHRSNQLVDHQLVWKHKKKGRPRAKGVCHVNNVGGRILSLRVDNLTFRCSYAHLTAPLRALPAMFGFEEQQKGEFPYVLLDQRNWDAIYPGLPPLQCYEVDQLKPSRREEVTLWWIGEQAAHQVPLATVRQQLVDAAIEPDEITLWLGAHQPWPQPNTQPWSFRDNLWSYLFADVDVGATALEQYHQLAEELTLDYRRVRNDPNLNDKIVSPLTSSTSPGWAMALYKAFFLPPNTLFVLRPPESRFVREGLRGGRTDKRVNVITASDLFKLVYVDFKSLYPSVMDCLVHNTHFPVGIPWWFDRRGWEPPSNQDLEAAIGDATGFLRVDTESIAYSTHPTLHHIGHRPEYEQQQAQRRLNNDTEASEVVEAEKLLFANTNHYSQVYAWPELQEAIRAGEIRVTKVHEGLLFQKSTHLFHDYVRVHAQIKDDAERDDNPGLRALAKLLLNSLWGKFGQRSYPVNEWITDASRLDWLMQQERLGYIEFQSYTRRGDRNLHVKYSKVDDLNNRASTAPHVAAFVSMWGRVVLHRKVLTVHGQRALYSDTDSAVIAIRAGDDLPWTGSNVGDLVNEVPKIAKDLGAPGPTRPHVYIHEFCAVAPKTYALHLKYDSRPDLCAFGDPYPSADYYKVVHKGFEPSWRTARKLNYAAMKNLVYGQNQLLPWRKRKFGQDHPDHRHVRPVSLIEGASTKLQFSSSLEYGKVAPLQTTLTKSLSGNCNKGRTHPSNPHLFIPFGRLPEPPWNDTFLDFPGPFSTTLPGPHYP